MEESFSLSTGLREGCHVVLVRGDVDEVTAPELDDAILRCPDGWPAVVDLTDVPFMSSAGLQVLMKPRLGRVVLVVCPAGNVRRVLDLVHAEESVPVFEHMDGAIDGMKLSRSA